MKRLRSLLLPGLVVLSFRPLSAQFEPRKDGYFSEQARDSFSAGIFLGPGFRTGVAGALLPGWSGGLTFRSRIGSGKLGLLAEVGFDRYEAATDGASRIWMSTGTSNFFLPTEVSVGVFLNQGGFERQTGTLAPFLLAGGGLVSHRKRTATGEVLLSGVSVTGQIGVEWTPLPPTFALRLALLAGGDLLGAKDTFDALANLGTTQLAFGMRLAVVTYLSP